MMHSRRRTKPTQPRHGMVHVAFKYGFRQQRNRQFRRGHILTLDDLDCWFETGPDGQGQLFYDGAPRPAADLEAVAAEIAARCAGGDLRATWRFEPAVSI